jgi:hypothetical protein
MVSRDDCDSSSLLLTERTISGMLGVREWQQVTVPFMDCKRHTMGMPTMLLRPSTTQVLPLGLMSYLCGASKVEKKARSVKAGR